MSGITYNSGSRSDILYGSFHVSHAFEKRPDFMFGVAVGVSIVDKDVAETINPINPVTGVRDNCLSRLLSDNTPRAERDLILSTLVEVKGYSSPKQLTNDDILSLLPSRYANDPTEVKHFLDYAKSVRDDALAKKEPDAPIPADDGNSKHGVGGFPNPGDAGGGSTQPTP